MSAPLHQDSFALRQYRDSRFINSPVIFILVDITGGLKTKIIILYSFPRRNNLNKTDFRNLEHAVLIEAVIALLYPKATLSEALRRVELVPFDDDLIIGQKDETPEGFIFRKEITNLYLVTNKSLVNIGSTEGLERANLSWIVQKFVKDDLYLKTIGQKIGTVLDTCDWEMAIAIQYVVSEDNHFDLQSHLKIAVLA